MACTGTTSLLTYFRKTLERTLLFSHFLWALERAFYILTILVDLLTKEFSILTYSMDLRRDVRNPHISCGNYKGLNNITFPVKNVTHARGLRI